MLPPGSTLLLYTDGLVERRDVPLADSLDELAEAAGEADEDLERALRPRAGGRARRARARATTWRCWRCGPRAAAGRGDPPVAAGRAGVARRCCAGGSSRFLHAAGADELEAYEITLTVCEAAGNAIEHAYGPGDASFDVEAALAADELAASVRDRGNWRERRGEHRGRGLKIIEGLMDEVDISKRGRRHRGDDAEAAGARRAA